MGYWLEIILLLRFNFPETMKTRKLRKRLSPHSTASYAVSWRDRADGTGGTVRFDSYEAAETWAEAMADQRSSCELIFH